MIIHIIEAHWWFHLNCNRRFLNGFGQSMCALWHTKSIKPRKFGNIVKSRPENVKKKSIFPHVISCRTNYHRFSLKISSKRELYVYIMIRGIRWKMNLDGPLGPRWRKSNMIKFKWSDLYLLYPHLFCWACWTPRHDACDNIWPATVVEIVSHTTVSARR